MNLGRRHRKRDDGSILSLAAISMMTILLAAGLAIDIGHWYLVGGELQNAADAAALAAASALDASPGGITQAVDRAVAIVNKYEFNHYPATIGRTDVRFAATLRAFDTNPGFSEAEAKEVGIASTIKFVKVTVPPKSVSVFFVHLATKSLIIQLTRSAVAGLSVTLNRFGNITPMAFVENRHNDPLAPALNSSSCGQASRQFVPGCQYFLPLLNSNALPTGGTAMILDLPTRHGSSVRERLALGCAGEVAIGQTIKRLMAGVTNQEVNDGLNVRFDRYAANLTATTFPPDANIMQGITRSQYRQPSLFTAPSHPGGVWERRVLVVPIITPDQYNAGTSTVTAKKFGAFFLRAAADHQGINVEYIGTPTIIGTGGFDPAGEAGAQGIATAVLYQ